MGEADPRLPEMTQGLGVVIEGRARYYPLRSVPPGGLEELWGERKLRVDIGATDGVPFAEWMDNGERPFQLLSRWYGFAFTYPECEFYTAQGD